MSADLIIANNAKMLIKRGRRAYTLLEKSTHELIGSFSTDQQQLIATRLTGFEEGSIPGLEAFYSGCCREALRNPIVAYTARAPEVVTVEGAVAAMVFAKAVLRAFQEIEDDLTLLTSPLANAGAIKRCRERFGPDLFPTGGRHDGSPSTGKPPVEGEQHANTTSADRKGSDGGDSQGQQTASETPAAA